MRRERRFHSPVIDGPTDRLSQKPPPELVSGPWEEIKFAGFARRISSQSEGTSSDADQSAVTSSLPASDIGRVIIDQAGEIRLDEFETGPAGVRAREKNLVEILDMYEFRDERAFEVARERAAIQTLVERYGSAQAREIAEHRLAYQLHGVMSEALKRPSSRQDGLIKRENGEYEILGFGDEQMGDVRGLTERSRQEFDDPRIWADSFGWAEIYAQLSNAPDGSGAILVSPGSMVDYPDDVLYFFRVQDVSDGAHTPYDRVIDKTSVLIDRQDLEVYRRLGRHFSEGQYAVRVSDRLTNARVQAGLTGFEGIGRDDAWNFLYYPFFAGEIDSLGALYKEVVGAGGMSSGNLPTREDVESSVGERVDYLEVGDRVIDVACMARRVTRMLFERGDDQDIEHVIDQWLLKAVGDHYEDQGLARPTDASEIKLACGTIGGKKDGMMEERERNGQTEYKCLQCGRWSVFPHGACDKCGYEIVCARGETKGDREVVTEDPSFIGAVLRRLR